MPAPFTGQISLTGSAQQIDPAGVAASCKAFTIKAPLSNQQRAFIGPASVTPSTGFQLDQGDTVTYERIAQSGQPSYEQQPSDYWAVGTAGDLVTWMAFP